MTFLWRTRSTGNAPVSSPSTATVLMSRKVRDKSLGLRSNDRLVDSKTLAAASFLTYSTSLEFSKLCSLHDGTVARFSRKLPGKKHLGGTCSFVTAAASHM